VVSEAPSSESSRFKDRSKGDNRRFLEDNLEDEWESVKEGFYEIIDLGANVVRNHLQLGEVLIDLNTPI
jgi:hypothetical protein